MMLEHKSVLRSMVGRLEESNGAEEVRKRGQDVVRQAQLAMQERLNAHSRDLNALHMSVSRQAVRADEDQQQLIDDLTASRRHALTRVTELEDEINDLKLVFVLGKSLSQETELKEEITSRTEQVKREEEVMRKEFERLRKENFELADRLLVAQRERNEAIEERNMAIQRSEKLEQVVGTLRRRIGGGLNSSSSSLSNLAAAGAVSPKTTSAPTVSQHSHRTAAFADSSSSYSRSLQPADNRTDLMHAGSWTGLPSVLEAPDGAYHRVNGVSPPDRYQAAAAASLPQHSPQRASLRTTPTTRAGAGVGGGSTRGAPAHLATTGHRTPRQTYLQEHIYAKPEGDDSPQHVEQSPAATHLAAGDDESENPYSVPFDSVLRTSQAIAVKPAARGDHGDDDDGPYASHAMVMNPVGHHKAHAGPAVKPYTGPQRRGVPKKTLPSPPGAGKGAQAMPEAVTATYAKPLPRSVRNHGNHVYSVPNKSSSPGAMHRRVTESAIGLGSAQARIDTTRSVSTGNPSPQVVARAQNGTSPLHMRKQMPAKSLSHTHI